MLNNVGGNYPNNVALNSAAAFFNVNINGTAPFGTNSNLFQFGTLTQSTSTVLTVTGGNNSKLAFTGGVNLTGAAPPTYNVASGVTLILPGGFTDCHPAAEYRRRRAGPQRQQYLFDGPDDRRPAGTGGVAAQANAVSAPYGAGNAITAEQQRLLAGHHAAGHAAATPVIPRAASAGGSIPSSQYQPNGFLNAVASSGIVPGAVVGGLPTSDTNIVNHPVNIMNTNNTNQPIYDIEVYSGLIDITNAGTYSFEQRNDDQGRNRHRRRRSTWWTTTAAAADSATTGTTAASISPRAITRSRFDMQTGPAAAVSRSCTPAPTRCGGRARRRLGKHPQQRHCTTRRP